MLGACVKAESVRDPGRPVRHLHVVERGNKKASWARRWVLTAGAE